MQQRREKRDGVEVAEVAASLDPLTELFEKRDRCVVHGDEPVRPDHAEHRNGLRLLPRLARRLCETSDFQPHDVAILKQAWPTNHLKQRVQRFLWSAELLEEGTIASDVAVLPPLGISIHTRR